MTELASQGTAAQAESAASDMRLLSKPGGQGTFIWSVLGVTALLIQAQIRLGQIAWEALSSGAMSEYQIAICTIWTLMNGYLEGYRGFHLRFVPRVIARAHYLAENPRSFPKVLGPIFAMAYVHAAKKAKYAAWGVTVAVFIAIVVVRRLPQPWRGIIDTGVVTGLALGTLSLLLAAVQRVLGRVPEGNPDLPKPASEEQSLAAKAE